MASSIFPPAAILGVRAALVDGDWVPGDVEVRDGRVTRVGVAPAGRGGVAVPGFVDAHLNGFAGVDFLAADVAGHARAAAALAATGVTGHVPTFITSPPEAYGPALAAAAAAAAASETAGSGPDTVPAGEPAGAPWRGSRVLGVHFEGPWLSPRWPGAHDPASLREPDVGEALALCAYGPVVLVTLAPERPAALDVVAALRRCGVAVSIGHTDADAAAVRAALDAGARSVTHLHNAHRRWAARDPGPAGVALTDARAHVMVIVDHVHLAPETAALAWAAAGPRLVLVSDAMEAAGQGDGTYRLGDRTVTVRSPSR